MAGTAGGVARPALVLSANDVVTATEGSE
jgi:hypothetical protein